METRLGAKGGEPNLEWLYTSDQYKMALYKKRDCRSDEYKNGFIYVQNKMALYEWTTESNVTKVFNKKWQYTSCQLHFHFLHQKYNG